MGRELNWLVDAGCREHTSLHPDAWYTVNQYGLPTGDGIKALGVCQTGCPVKDQCREYMARLDTRGAIAGGGWFNNQGIFHEQMPGQLVDSTYLADFFGISLPAVRHLVKEGVITAVGKSFAGRYTFAMADIAANTDKIKNMVRELATWELERKRKAAQSKRKPIRKATAARWEAMT